MKLGVCYYPEHWPEQNWSDDARRMREIGIDVVRIGEFAWSRLEPSRGEFHFDWLHRAIEVLHKKGLKLILGTPTATPPKWLVDEHPSVLAIDEHGRPRGFGSRRHYCFSSDIYREECARIVTAIASEFGRHEAVTAWQTDNEYGCHSTIISYSPCALDAFRHWCRERYSSIEHLNTAWGNVFWSMEYSSFDQIPLPSGAVTELNPAHRLAFWRFSSDQVASFNRLQTDILRTHSPARDLLHNYMGNFTEFDHTTTAADLDIATWDNYPLGFLDRDSSDQADQQKWYRTGHPDSSAFHHDLYRALGGGRFWVMEQQPGPVNWAPHNPAPLDGMVRLWAWEAFAHGAEVMSWFRWRQAPFAQEQMHTGLLLPDGSEDSACEEIRLLKSELSTVDIPEVDSAPVALIFDYAGDQMLRIQPQGENYQPLEWVMQQYTAIRRTGVNVDILFPGQINDTTLEPYQLVVLANTVTVSGKLSQHLQRFQGHIVIGPRSGSKTEEYSIEPALPPGELQKLIPLRVTRVESLPEFARPQTDNGFTATRWREKVCTNLPPVGKFPDEWGFYYRHGDCHYLNCCLTPDSLLQFFTQRIQEAGIETTDCSEGLRVRRRGSLYFAFNYGPEVVTLESGNRYIVGNSTLLPAHVAVWQRQAS
ncbi:beta-galactosidase [Chromatiales bacterium (ex Bugula neritina AB1)]|nr:beta-galactosidase [Chromatiales bacterium (ex Bugula neritina AB1)]